MLWNDLYLWDVHPEVISEMYFLNKKDKKILKLEFRLLEYQLIKTMIHLAFFHVGHKFSSYFNMSETWQIYEK